MKGGENVLKKIIQGSIGVISAVGGFYVTKFLMGHFMSSSPTQVLGAALALGMIISGLIGLSVAPWIVSGVERITNWLLSQLFKMPIQDIAGGVIGLIIGLLIANLLESTLGQINYIGPYLSVTGSLLLAYAGLSVGVKKKEELFSLLSAIPRFGMKDKNAKSEQESEGNKILDTSVIIDGRIADICKTGFIEGTLIIPNFVLEELRHVADSSDLLKRNRGRRGLDILNKIRKELDVMVQIVDKDYEDILEVDSKLVKLAQDMNGDIITNDYNLNKVAQIQGVKVLNINELANAVKPIVHPGEEMFVQVIKDGKELGQGVAYLDDGTMIVVEHGKKYIGQNITVLVTSVLQTAAGRMIFAKPKQTEKKQTHTSMNHQLDGRGEVGWPT